MMEPSENATDKVLSLVKDFIDLRDTLVDRLLDIAVTPEVRLWAMTLISDNRLLPFDNWIGGCPESLGRFLQDTDWIERGRSLSFVQILDWMTNGNSLTRPDLVDECFDYVKKHRTIGTIIDW